MSDSSVVWVTGAGSGIGKAIAQRYAREGHRVVASGRSLEALNDLVETCRGEAGDVLPVVCDVRDESSVEQAWTEIIAAVGNVDTLINNAGVTVFKPFVNSTLADFDAILNTNLRGVFLCTQKALAPMLERGEGSIVMVNSMSAKEVFSNSAVYAATKAGLKMMTDCLRLEVRKEGVRVISVFPGATNTPIWNEKVREKHGDKMMSPDIIAEVIFNAWKLPKGVLVEDVFVQPAGGSL